jgi:hypothetical protein
MKVGVICEVAIDKRAKAGKIFLVQGPVGVGIRIPSGFKIEYSSTVIFLQRPGDAYVLSPDLRAMHISDAALSPRRGSVLKHARLRLSGRYRTQPVRVEYAQSHRQAMQRSRRRPSGRQL